MSLIWHIHWLKYLFTFSIIQRDQNELLKSVNRVHSIKDSSLDDEETNEDKSDIGYISDASIDDEMVGKARKRLSKKGIKTGKTKKRKATSKADKEPPKKIKKISKNQVRQIRLFI